MMKINSNTTEPLAEIKMPIKTPCMQGVAIDATQYIDLILAKMVFLQKALHIKF